MGATRCPRVLVLARVVWWWRCACNSRLNLVRVFKTPPHPSRARAPPCAPVRLCFMCASCVLSHAVRTWRCVLPGAVLCCMLCCMLCSTWRRVCCMRRVCVLPGACCVLCVLCVLCDLASFAPWCGLASFALCASFASLAWMLPPPLVAQCILCILCSTLAPLCSICSAGTPSYPAPLDPRSLQRWRSACRSALC